jgi:hypothetical protein
MKYLMLVASLAIAAAGGCAEFPGTQSSIDTAALTSPDIIPGLPKGYECPLIPNGLDPAGSIYRLDKNGAYYRVKDFSEDPEIAAKGNFKKIVPISNYRLSDQQMSSAGLSFNLLKAALPGLSASASGDMRKEIAVDVTVQELEGEIIDDTVADRIVDRFKTTIQPKAESRYFLVRESVKAGSVSYRLRQADLAKLGGKGQVEKLAEGSANVTLHDNDGTVEVKQSFAPAKMPICVKSAEIVIDKKGPTLDAPIAVSLKTPEETSVPQIKRVGDN